MKRKDIMMESIADLMWNVEDEVTPNQVVPIMEIDCVGRRPSPGEPIPYPQRPYLLAKGCALF